MIYIFFPDQHVETYERTKKQAYPKGLSDNDRLIGCYYFEDDLANAIKSEYEIAAVYQPRGVNKGYFQFLSKELIEVPNWIKTYIALLKA